MFRATQKIVPKTLPKAVKYITPWYIRWTYSICGDRFKMASSSIVPEAVTTSDSVVSSIFSATLNAVVIFVCHKGFRLFCS